jgi:hypothetical protein
MVLTPVLLLVLLDGLVVALEWGLRFEGVSLSIVLDEGVGVDFGTLEVEISVHEVGVVGTVAGAGGLSVVSSVL